MKLFNLFDNAKSFLGVQPSFRATLLPILKELGWEPMDSSPASILLLCDHEGYGIPVGLYKFNETVCIQAVSNLKFEGGVDPTLRRILESSNGHTNHDHIRYIVGKRVSVQSSIPLSGLNSDSLGSRLREMLPLIRAFDEEFKHLAR
jgi:hypothetical protein